MNNTKHYTFEKSRCGETVPALIMPDGNTQALHSMVDPMREARRLISQITEDTGFLIFLGLGGGFAVEAALELTLAQIIVIDFDSCGIAELFANRDYSKLLQSGRIRMFVDIENEEIKKIILENYRPSIDGGIKMIPLRARVEQDREKFEKAAAAIQETIDIITGDYSVQSHFGIRWFSNIIRNVKNIDALGEVNQPQAMDFPVLSVFLNKKKAVKEAAIIAAGPSLDYQLDTLAQLKAKNVFIISSDTALGALIQRGIEPDAVVSIDCQHISYYHFLGFDIRSKLHNIPLVLDIASPPLLSGFSYSPLFFASGHPLAIYICACWRPFLQLDTSGGNVTFSCLSLAESLGAERITLFGADFSYVNCQTYARGTYINPYFSDRQNRLSTLESQMSAFLYRSPFLPPEDGENKNYRETSSLRFYRKKLEEKASAMPAIIGCAKGFGAPVNINNIKCKIRNDENTQRKMTGNRKFISGMDFLKQYRDDISALPEAKEDEGYFEELNVKEKQIFTTLLPFAAAARKRNNDLKTNDLIEEVKRRSIAKIDAIL